jgi:uncharacterized protein YbjQ (UPF0145 family)
MKSIKYLAIAAAIAAVPAHIALAAGNDTKSSVVVNEDVGVPVFAYDITDRPYTVVGEVKAGVRKATVFSKEASQGKIYRELWERAQKLGADAVINAKYGDSHISAFSWGKTNATGTAIKFTAATTPAVVAPAAGETAATGEAQAATPQ